MSGPILIQGAMEAETDWLTSQIEYCKDMTVGGYRFWKGSYQGRELVVSRTEIGELNAACVTTLGILHFAPSAVINQGIAGSHSEEVHIGDIIVGESCIHINDWETQLKGRGEGTDPLSWSRGMVDPLLLYSDAALLERFLSSCYGGGKLIKGRLGSGDLFSREYDRILWLRKKCGHICEDMESIAVYKVCQRLSVPCLGVRIISNNELTGELYTPAVGKELQRFILELVFGGIQS